MQLKSKRFDHFHDGRKLGVSFPGQCFVKAFPAKAGISGKLGHSSCTGDIAQCFGNVASIVSCFFRDTFNQVNNT